MKTNTTEFKLKTTQDDYCYTIAEIELWFDRGQCGFVDLWELHNVAVRLEEAMEQLELELAVEDILSEVEGRHEVSSLIAEILTPDNDVLDIDVEYSYDLVG